MEKPNIVQLNNQYITDETMRQRYEEEENRQRNRFIGWILVFIILLFILPTYNLASSYNKILQRREEIVELENRYQEIKEEKEKKEAYAEKLKDTEYLQKYARAKYYYSLEGEQIFPTPDLLPK